MLCTLRPACLVCVSLLAIGLALPAMAVDQQMSQAIEAAKENFRPVTPEQVDAAREDLIQAAQRFERFLGPGSRKGEGWKRYLKWDGVQESLSKPLNPELGPLRESLDRFRAGTPGTELPIFRQTASAMEKFLDLSAIARASDQQAFVDRQLELLTEYLDSYESDPSTRNRFEIERRLDFFAGIGRGREVTTALRNEFNHPNVRAEISERFLRRVAGKPVDECNPVEDCILGTTIRGTGRTIGSVDVQTLPNSRRAELLITLSGTTYSQTRGYNDPVVIRSSGTTPFTATKRVELEDANFWNYPAKVTATTRTKTLSVQKQGGGLGGRFIAKIGEKKVEEKKPQANYIAARHAEERIADNLEEELLPKLQDFRYEYLNSFKKPFADRNAEPRMVAFSSTHSSINVDMLQAGRGELGAESAPGAFPGGQDVSIRLHETGAANLASGILAGATLSQKTEEGKPKLNVELPSFLRKAIDKSREETETEPAEDDGREFKPWSITFRRLRPISVDFKDDLVTIRIHSARIQVKDETYDGWDIIVTYSLVVENGGLKLLRDGEIDVLPTSFDPTSGRGLSNRQVGLRGNLAKELNRQADSGRGFPKEIDLGPLDLPDNLAKYGPLYARDASSTGGWLSLGWMLP